MNTIQIAPGKVRVEAPAKINLFLQVLNRRPDGYHNINSLFQAVSLRDTLTVALADAPGVRLDVIGEDGLPAGEDNLVVRAARLMAREFGLNQGLHIVLEKRIPVAAGLGGGSSDAAATIEAINHLFGLRLAPPDRMHLGLLLGSDVPFFFTRGQALVRGRGELMEETEFPTDYGLLLVNPGFPLSTATAYAALKRNLTDSGVPFNLPCCRAVDEYVHHLGQADNDFESIHRRSHPELDEIAGELLKRGAVLARMSGSGPTVFGLFASEPEHQDLVVQRRGNWRCYAVAPITLLSQES